MGPQESLTRRKILLISVVNELTYPEFYFETNNDSLTGMQHSIKAIMFQMDNIHACITLDID